MPDLATVTGILSISEESSFWSSPGMSLTKPATKLRNQEGWDFRLSQSPKDPR